MHANLRACPRPLTRAHEPPDRQGGEECEPPCACALGLGLDGGMAENALVRMLTSGKGWLMLVALTLPPLGVMVAKGKVDETLWTNLLLCLMGWLPGNRVPGGAWHWVGYWGGVGARAHDVWPCRAQGRMGGHCSAASACASAACDLA